jgi:alcohol dehydrogenase class IV
MTFWHKDPAIQTMLPVAFSRSVLHLLNVFTAPKIMIGPNAMPDTPQMGPSPIDVLINSGRRKAFIIADNFSVRFAKKICAFLDTGDISYEIWDGALPDAPLDTVEACYEKVKVFEPDIIFGLGGGSALDTAKAVWIRYERDDIVDLRQLSPLEPLNLRRKAIFAAVPTTSGTGSECTYGAVLLDNETHNKFVILGQEMVPDMAFLIPEFHSTMPPALTVGSGLDVLAHAMDTITNPACSDYPEALAGKAIQLVFDYLPRAYKDGNDMDARYKMMVAASMAGVAMNMSIAHFTHLMGHAFGNVFNQHHGLAVGFFIPHSLQWCSATTERHTIICKYLEIQGDDSKELLQKLVLKTRNLLTELDVPLALSHLVDEKTFAQKLDKMSQEAYEDITNLLVPRPITVEQCRRVFEYAYEGKDIDF